MERAMTERFGARLARATLKSPAFWLGAVAWAGLNIGALALADGALPFDRPALAMAPFWLQVALPTGGLLQIFLLMGIVYWLTRRRAVPDMAARAPARGRAAAETLGLLVYAMLGQAGGWIVGPAFGYRAFSFHLAGTLVGCTTPPSAGEAIV